MKSLSRVQHRHLSHIIRVEAPAEFVFRACGQFFRVGGFAEGGLDVLERDEAFGVAGVGIFVIAEREERGGGDGG